MTWFRTSAAGASAFALALVAVIAGAAPARAQEDRYTVTMAPDYGEVEPGQRVALQAQLYRKGEATYSHHDWEWQADGGGFQNGYRTPLPQNIWIAPSRPGTYTVKVTTERAKRGGNWATATFIIKARLRNLRVGPTPLTLRPGEAVRFAIACDGTWRPNELAWVQVEGGAFESFDTFRAGPTAGLYTLGLQDTLTGELAHVSVRVERPAYRGLVIEPRELLLRPGEWRDLDVRLGAPLDWTQLRWTRVEGGAIEGTRRFRAGAVPGAYTLVLTDALTGEEATVVVRVRGAVLALEPATVTLYPGQSIRFTPRHDGAWRAGRFAWTRMEGGRATAWDTFEAGTAPGRYQLDLRDQDTGDIASVVVVIERQLRLTPETITVRPGDTVRFDVAHRRAFRWTELRWIKAEGGAMTGGRAYMAGSVPGRYQVRIKDTVTGEEAWSWVTIEAPTVAAVAIAPKFLRARAGERVRLTVQAFGAQNEALLGSYRWEVVGGGGACTADGWFTPDCAPGRHVRIRVTEVRSGRWDEADIFVHEGY